MAYGGSQLNKWGWSKVGTLCVNAIDNDTGEYGILTNDHVAVHRDSQFGIISSENLYLKGFAGAKIGKASKYNNKTIDAAFVPFTNQNDWEPTTYAKYENTIYDNVKMGSNDFIIQGMPVKKIGLTSGISTGYIISSNVAKGGLSNIFSYSNNHAKGDSGGPVYYDDGQNLFLIGMHFAGDYNNDGNPIGNGYSCKMTEIARILNVTPLTNNSVFDTTLLPNDTIRINQVNYVAPNGEVTIPSSLYGKSVSQIGTSAFANITSVTSITIPETITFIGDYAFENCTNLEFVSIPNNSATIGKQPFKGCTKIYGYITSKNSSQHRNINIFGELSWGDHIYSLGECSICDWVHENHTHIIIGTPSYHYQDCTICHDRIYCSGTAIFHSYNENSHSYLCGTCDEMLTASHTYNNGVCTICNYHHQGHIYDAHYNGTQSSHYLECLTCGYENYCPSNASLVSQTDTMHTYTCNNLSCNYTKTEDHNYNTSQICIDCDYHGPGTHSHLFTHYYIPVSSTGEFMGFKRHLAYCACGDSKLMACIGEYLGPETEVYCTLCGQYMGGGGLLFSFTLPNGDVYLSTEKITLDDYMGLARFLGIEYKMSDYYDVLVSFTSNSYVLEDYFIIIEEK